MTMRNSNGRIFWFVPITVILVIAVYYFFGWSILTRLHPERCANDMAELVEKVNVQLDEGKESGSFYVTGISKEQIAGINEYVCSMNGMVDQYSVTEQLTGGMRLRLKYKISDNYYVYKCFSGGEPIPADRPTAAKLYEEVKTVMGELIRDTMTDYEKELAIHDYIVKHCEYGYADGAQENAYRAYGVLINHKAVCNGYAEAMSLLLSCAGVENRIIVGYADDELHAWNLVKLSGKWYQVDATWDDPLPDRGDFAGHAYFNVTDEIMGYRHTWEEGTYEVCSDMDQNYFRVNNLVLNHVSLENTATVLLARSPKTPIEVILSDYTKEYDLSFFYRIPGVGSVRYTEPEPYGLDTLITFYINE